MAAPLKLQPRTRIVSPTSVIQLEYPLANPAPTPANDRWTRFVLLSDTHAHTFPVPAGDVLLHAGDLTRRGTFRDLRHTMEWLYALPHPIKMFVIAGNRDFALHREWYDANWEDTGRPEKPAKWEPPDPLFELLTGPRAVAANIVYLRDQQYTFKIRPDGREWTVYGSPQSPNFGARVRAFGYDAEDAEAIVSTFPATDILMTHGPPHGILDLAKNGACAGCPALTRRVAAAAPHPRLHVFGHIHEARGAHVHRWAADRDAGSGPSAQNASQLCAGGSGGGAPRVGSGSEEAVGAGAQTVFVNASNWPAGPSAREAQGVGGPGVQPIVVDLLE